MNGQNLVASFAALADSRADISFSDRQSYGAVVSLPEHRMMLWLHSMSQFCYQYPRVFFMMLTGWLALLCGNRRLVNRQIWLLFQFPPNLISV